MNKASGGDGIAAELFQILEDDAVKMLHSQYASKFGKLSSGHGTGKGQFSFQSQIKAMPKNAHNYRTIALEGNGNPLQCSCLENPRDGGAWAAVSGVAQSWTRLKRLSSSSSTR